MVETRHSGGKLRGLGLALFDVLFFPLLALNALMVWNATRLVRWSIGQASRLRSPSLRRKTSAAQRGHVQARKPSCGNSEK